jgi:hypothetical protein
MVGTLKECTVRKREMENSLTNPEHFSDTRLVQGTSGARPKGVHNVKARNWKLIDKS